MLERNDDSRPSFVKLADSLPTNLKNLPSTLNLSIMKTQIENGQSKTLTNTGSSFAKVLNPLVVGQSKRMNGTLVSEYRPEVEVS